MYKLLRDLRCPRLRVYFVSACILGGLASAESVAAARLAYIAEGFGAVHVMNTGNRAVTATIPSAIGFTDVSPTALVTDPAGTFVYEGLTDVFSNGWLAIIDARTNAVAATVPVGTPNSIVTSANGMFVYILTGGFACCEASAVKVLSSNSHSVEATIPVDSFPGSLLANPVRSAVYAINIFGTILVIDTNTNTVSANIELNTGTTTGAMTVDPTGTFIYVVGSTSETVSVVNTLNNGLVATIPVGFDPREIAIHPSGGLLFVTNWGSGTVSIIDTTTNMVVADVPVGPAPGFLKVDPDGRYLYVLTSGATLGAKVLSVIDVVSRQVVLNRPEEYGISDIEMDPDGGALYVLNNATNRIEVLTVAGDRILATVPMTDPSSIVFGKQVASPPVPTVLAVPALSAVSLILMMAALGVVVYFQLARGARRK